MKAGAAPFICLRYRSGCGGLGERSHAGVSTGTIAVANGVVECVARSDGGAGQGQVVVLLALAIDLGRTPNAFCNRQAIA